MMTPRIYFRQNESEEKKTLAQHAYMLTLYAKLYAEADTSDSESWNSAVINMTFDYNLTEAITVPPRLPKRHMCQTRPRTAWTERRSPWTPARGGQRLRP